MYLELVGKPCKLKTIFLTVHICSFFSINIVLCLVKGGKLRYKELWGFRHAIDDFLSLFFVVVLSLLYASILCAYLVALYVICFFT